MDSWLPLQSSRVCNCAFRTFPCPKRVDYASQSRLKVSCHPLSWMPAGRGRFLKAARFNNLRHIILKASTADLNEEIILGSQMKGRLPRQLNADAILVVTEGICISIAFVSCLASLTVHGSQDSRLVKSSVLEPIMQRKADLPVWQTTFLLAALIINSILRARQRPSRDSSAKLAIQDPNLEERVQKLEEDVTSAVTIVRVLSKQLEKLAVRFRVTRQTLRDPIQETAVLAQKTSESVSILAARENALEKNLEEMHHVLLRMQENQSKQLELISTLGKLVKDRPVKKIETNNNAAPRNSLGIGLPRIGQERVDMENTNILQNKAMTKRGGSTKRSSTLEDRSPAKGQQVREQSADLANNVRNHLKPGCRAADSQKVDFWRVPLSQVEDFTEETIKDHFSNDGKPKTKFLD